LGGEVARVAAISEDGCREDVDAEVGGVGKGQGKDVACRFSLSCGCPHLSYFKPLKISIATGSGELNILLGFALCFTLTFERESEC
jgi:hypothetical protein